MCMNQSELTEVLASYKSVKALEAEVSKELEGLRKQILEYMEETNQSKTVVGDYKVSTSTVNKFSWKADELNNLLGSEADNYKKPYSYVQLRVS